MKKKHMRKRKKKVAAKKKNNEAKKARGITDNLPVDYCYTNGKLPFYCARTRHVFISGSLQSDDRQHHQTGAVV